MTILQGLTELVGRNLHDRGRRSLDQMRRNSTTDDDEEEDYTEEVDMLFVFPPEKYRLGDYSMSVLMSGYVHPVHPTYPGLV